MATRILLLLILIFFASTKAFAPSALPRGYLLRRQYAAAIEDSSVVTFPVRISAEESLALLDGFILPDDEYGDRIRYGRDAQGLDRSGPVLADDPKMAFTYGEFPTDSFDALLDLALKHTETSKGPFRFVDIGSGCGRLAFHAGLTRGTDNRPWHIHGIEISEILHGEALKCLKICLDEELLTTESMSSGNNIVFHVGPAEELKSVFEKCNLAFAYSTVWPCSGFSEKLGAMVLDKDWSEMLSKACPKGCVIITTDRALDPEYGWELLHKLDVDNKEVMGSTGYIQILR